MTLWLIAFAGVLVCWSLLGLLAGERQSKIVQIQTSILAEQAEIERKRRAGEL